MAGPQRPGDSTRRCLWQRCTQTAHGPKNVHTARSSPEAEGQAWHRLPPTLTWGFRLLDCGEDDSLFWGDFGEVVVRAAPGHWHRSPGAGAGAQAELRSLPW